jgi:hypothetical protein
MLMDFNTGSQYERGRANNPRTGAKGRIGGGEGALDIPVGYVHNFDDLPQ